MGHMLTTLVGRGPYLWQGVRGVAHVHAQRGSRRARPKPLPDSPREVIRGCLTTNGVHPTEADNLAALVCQAFRGCLVRFHAVAIDHRHRDEAVRAARAAGASLGSLAQRFKLSRTHIRRICREL